MIVENEKFVLLFLDLNNFKRINDDFGHAIGDKYLKNFSEEITKICLKFNARAYRIAGDEFVVMSLGDESEDIIHSIKEGKMKRIDIGVHFLGVSVGLASFPGDGKTMDGLINISDKRMYDNKRNTN